jgi:hypothetical protein
MERMSQLLSDNVAKSNRSYDDGLWSWMWSHGQNPETVWMSWRSRESYLKGYEQYRQNREEELIKIREELRAQRMFLEYIAQHLWGKEK